jgi:polar amino acid transport system substrate-binding protein
VDKLIEQALKDGTLNNFSQKWMQAPLPATLGV